MNKDTGRRDLLFVQFMTFRFIRLHLLNAFIVYVILSLIHM